MPAGTLLDVGCHVGTFLELAEQAGSRSPASSRRAGPPSRANSRIAGPVHSGAVEDAPMPEHGYDVVTLWDVIEHLPDPALDLRAIFGALRPGGILAISTMDVDSLFARRRRKRWPWYMQMHLVYFSRRTLCRDAAPGGLRDRRRAPAPPARAPLVPRLAARRLRPLAARRAGAALTRGAGSATARVGVKLGDIFTVIARKPLPR